VARLNVPGNNSTTDHNNIELASPPYHPTRLNMRQSSDQERRPTTSTDGATISNTIKTLTLSSVLLLTLLAPTTTAAFSATYGIRHCPLTSTTRRIHPVLHPPLHHRNTQSNDDGDKASQPVENDIFESFSTFLQKQQSQIIREIEAVEHKAGSSASFTRDTWGIFDPSLPTGTLNSGGITRVLQSGTIIEKGACSFTLLQNGTLTPERAAAVRGRRADDDDGAEVRAGDTYAAAALSMVLHPRSPLVPTFRSDVRIFLVRPEGGDRGVLAWFGGGADLTPCYLFEEDVVGFHGLYRDMCDRHGGDGADVSYPVMKKSCDEYFYLPARGEHRGTGGIFFDDLPATSEADAFVRDVAGGWMPSWLPIVARRQGMEYTEQQRDWQLVRRGRYLEFNLLYDRGVKFGLGSGVVNPRVEGVMVSAPPLVRWEYNYEVEEGGEEERLVEVLKTPLDWV